MHCNSYQFLTSQLPVYSLVTCFAASTMLNLSAEDARGTLLEEGVCLSGSLVLSIPLWGFFVLGFVCFCFLLLEALYFICIPCMHSLPTNSCPQSQPGDHLTDYSPDVDPTCFRPPTTLPVSGLPAPHLGGCFCLP